MEKGPKESLEKACAWLSALMRFTRMQAASTTRNGQQNRAAAPVKPDPVRPYPVRPDQVRPDQAWVGAACAHHEITGGGGGGQPPNQAKRQNQRHIHRQKNRPARGPGGQAVARIWARHHAGPGGGGALFLAQIRFPGMGGAARRVMRVAPIGVTVVLVLPSGPEGCGCRANARRAR